MPSSITHSTPVSDSDVEKGVSGEKSNPLVGEAVEVDEGTGTVTNHSGVVAKTWKFLLASGVEARGIEPVPVELRTESGFNKIFTIWFTSLLCPLPLVTGMLGPLAYGMSVRDTSLLILFFSFLMCIPPAYVETISPRTGMRQMIQARFSFGMYANILPVVLNMMTLCGYSIICLVTAGQLIAAVSGDTVSQTVGIVIVAILSMIPAFGGFKILHHYERWAWIPAIIAIIITLGSGGSKLKDQAEPIPITGPTAITFISFLAGYMLPYCATVGDVAVYMGPNPPKWRIFFYCLMGICLPSVLLMIVGAAIGGAVPNHPDWLAGYNTDSVGGVLVAMLKPLGGFGKFIAVILALSVVAQISPGFYCLSINFQIISPKLARIPRFLFVVIVTAIDIGVGIAASESFFDSLEDFLGVIGYWGAGFSGILLSEWIVIRKRNPDSYDHAIWNNAKALPSGLAALTALVVPFALVVPSMGQAWFTGPIAKVTGDLGFEFALILAIILYIPLRYLEIKIQKRI